MTPIEASALLLDTAKRAPVIPVLIVNDVAKAAPLAQALVDGGLTVLEVTLRTAGALDAITEMAKVPGAFVGVGTLLSPQNARDALAAGASFGVSPGSTEPLMDTCEEIGLPLLPGAASATEAMRLLDRGYAMQKFFPAEAAGGAPALKSFASPLPQISFCPTGGVTPANAPDYLSLPNTVCVGGSWVTPAAMVEAGDWAGITALAAEAATLSAG